jgi:hypothetical protein
VMTNYVRRVDFDCDIGTNHVSCGTYLRRMACLSQFLDQATLACLANCLSQIVFANYIVPVMTMSALIAAMSCVKFWAGIDSKKGPCETKRRHG